MCIGHQTSGRAPIVDFVVRHRTAQRTGFATRGSIRVCRTWNALAHRGGRRIDQTIAQTVPSFRSAKRFFGHHRRTGQFVQATHHFVGRRTGKAATRSGVFVRNQLTRHATNFLDMNGVHGATQRVGFATVGRIQPCFAWIAITQDVVGTVDQPIVSVVLAQFGHARRTWKE